MNLIPWLAVFPFAFRVGCNSFERGRRLPSACHACFRRGV